MNFQALASLLGGKIVREGEKSRTRFAVIHTKARKILLLQREWNGKTAYLVDPSKADLARAAKEPFEMFSDVPHRLC